jgi:hypothetical protein
MGSREMAGVLMAKFLLLLEKKAAPLEESRRLGE